jgi:hypothetical protein
MSDLIQRLRKAHRSAFDVAIFDEAADRIAELEEEQETLMIMVESHKMVFEDQKKRIAQLEKEVQAMIYTVGRLQ